MSNYILSITICTQQGRNVLLMLSEEIIVHKISNNATTQEMKLELYQRYLSTSTPKFCLFDR